jgi:hypothetical protein
MLCACAVARRFGLEPGFDASAILRATDVSKSRAYEVAGALAESLPALTRPPGRPPAERATPAPSEGAELAREVLAYVLEHPGSAKSGPVRQHYSDRFRRFLVELRARFPHVDIESFAHATCVPLGTLKSWLSATSPSDVAEPMPERAPTPTETPPLTEAPAPIETPTVEAVGDRRDVQLVLAAWSRWKGSFGDFCDHAQRELRVPFGRSLLARILEVHRVRMPARRPGRAPDERATRGAFRTFFPGAQWIGDGMQVPVFVDGRRFTFNVELDVDAHSGGLVGASVRDDAHDPRAAARAPARQPPLEPHPRR